MIVPLNGLPSRQFLTFLMLLPLMTMTFIFFLEANLDAIGSRFSSKIDAFVALPSIFWAGISDNSLLI